MQIINEYVSAIPAERKHYGDNSRTDTESLEGVISTDETQRIAGFNAERVT